MQKPEHEDKPKIYNLTKKEFEKHIGIFDLEKILAEINREIEKMR